MPADRLAVYTTVYPGVEPFLAEWYESLCAQTDQQFDLWIGADVLTPAAVGAAVGRPLVARWMRSTRGETPAGLRGRVITHLTRRYDAIVFVDADDVLEPERVAAARAGLVVHDVDACALQFVDAFGQPFGGPQGEVFAPQPGEDPSEALPWRNAYGLSNTAYRSATLRRCLPLPAACLLPDWLLATRAWLLGATLGFDTTPHMRYRQHAATMAHARRPVTAVMVLTATAHALAHYRHVLAAPWPAARDASDARLAVVEGARARAQRFCRAVASASDPLDAYVAALNALPDARVPRAWWWTVAHPDFEALWNT